MFCTRKVNDDYTWVGADGRRLAMFEGVYDVPRGVSFNSYLLTDGKTVLFDTADASVCRVFLENVAHGLNGRALDYLVVQHMEPDHAADIRDLLVRHPETTVVCSAAAKNMLAQFFGPGYEGRISVVKEGDTLCTGRHTLHFVAAPMVHWPEVLMTYDETDKLLLTADAFGTFGALNGALFADEVDFHRDYLDEARRYYTNIVGKYGAQVQAVLKKAGGLDIQMLLPLHGFVWRQDLGYILGKYDLWSRYEPEERGVVIAYASVYGGTENAANILACRLREQGVQVAMYDTSVTPASYILAAAFRFSHVVLAAPTYNAGVRHHGEPAARSDCPYAEEPPGGVYRERVLGSHQRPGHAEAPGASEMGAGRRYRDPAFRPAPGPAGGAGAHGHAAGGQCKRIVYRRKISYYVKIAGKGPRFFRHEILSRRSWRSISRRTPSTSGTVRAKAHTSDNDWASCTPSSPSTWGRISTAGMKNSPCRATASSDACHTLLMVWVSMLEMTMTPHRGNTAH